jgi:putative transposase
MPRVARFVCPNVPHHVTQRGNRRGHVFFGDADFRTYLAWLCLDARRFGMEVLAYCLMSNHVHLVAVPKQRDSLSRTLQHMHLRYAQRVNRAHRWSGHVWQGRYFSAPLDEGYFWNAVRYVELNPVRAGLVNLADQYPWSSARAHCEGSRDPLLTVDPTWTGLISAIGDWSSWLGVGLQAAELDILRRHTRRGLPCGTPGFVRSLEVRAGRPLTWRPQGRPRRQS